MFIFLVESERPWALQGFHGDMWKEFFFGILKEIVQLYICLHTNIKKKTLVITQIHVISYD